MLTPWTAKPWPFTFLFLPSPKQTHSMVLLNETLVLRGQSNSLIQLRRIQKTSSHRDWWAESSSSIHCGWRVLEHKGFYVLMLMWPLTSCSPRHTLCFRAGCSTHNGKQVRGFRTQEGRVTWCHCCFVEQLCVPGPIKPCIDNEASELRKYTPYLQVTLQFYIRDQLLAEQVKSACTGDIWTETKLQNTFTLQLNTVKKKKLLL